MINTTNGRPLVINLATYAPSTPQLAGSASEPALGAMLATAADLQVVQQRLCGERGTQVDLGPAASVFSAALQSSPPILYMPDEQRAWAPGVWRYLCGMRTSAGIWVDEQGRCEGMHVQLSPFHRAVPSSYYARGALSRPADAWAGLITAGGVCFPISLETKDELKGPRATSLLSWYESYQAKRGVVDQILSDRFYYTTYIHFKSNPEYDHALRFIHDQEQKIRQPNGVHETILEGGALLYLNRQHGAISDADENRYQWIMGVPEGAQLEIRRKLLEPGLYGLMQGEYVVRGGSTLYHVSGSKVETVGRPAKK